MDQVKGGFSSPFIISEFYSCQGVILSRVKSTLSYLYIFSFMYDSLQNPFRCRGFAPQTNLQNHSEIIFNSTLNLSRV